MMSLTLTFLAVLCLCADLVWARILRRRERSLDEWSTALDARSSSLDRRHLAVGLREARAPWRLRAGPGPRGPE